MVIPSAQNLPLLRDMEEAIGSQPYPYIFKWQKRKRQIFLFFFNNSISHNAILEVEPWCDGKCLPQKATMNQPLQLIIRDKTAYYDLYQIPHKWEYYAPSYQFLKIHI